MSTLLSHRHRIRPVALLRLFLGILLPLLVVGLVAEDLLEGQSFAWETPFLLALHSHATPLLNQVALFFTTVGGVTVIAPVSAVILVVLWLRGHRLAAFWGLGVAGAAGLNVAMKLLMHRTRPELWPRLVQEHDASFPSGHSMYSAAFVTALILLAWRTPYRWPALGLGVAFSGLVGFSRLYLGVHYPTDVLCGWLTGAAWVLGVYGVLRPFAPGHGKESAA
ncbi:phosphoesterase, PA-phosphatase-like protein [Deinococcus aerius]|uniref:Phosphoesterase, PA-phosphatase-like protein n=2 Tax=Deinococcus TaxID=1298 RepID=A0A2I9CSC6_9DEIO|nr:MULTISPECIES: phosphatase PAP2 family protein [Deinococcus]MBB5293998.1 undecaprenyl-diphosphatase [Deinococcus metallilatus]GBF04543.1 phosphoesterase, PA-phosphatase-like protein [Deinococcus aerius]GMA17929.1 phosphatidylglycerophosphatase B [Deinococcus metallilatus]